MGDPDATGYAMMALQAAGHQSAALDRAAQWLKKIRNADGSWTAQHVHNVDSTGLAAAALRAHGVATSRSAAWLTSQQVRTGPTIGAGATRGALKYNGAFDAASSVKATADGILGMVGRGSLATLSDAAAIAGTPVLALKPGTVQRKRVVAGRAQTVSATGFAAHEAVAGVLRPGGRSVGTARSDKDGSVTLTFTVPRSATGSRSVVLTGARSGLRTETASFHIAAAPATRSCGSGGRRRAFAGRHRTRFTPDGCRTRGRARSRRDRRTRFGDREAARRMRSVLTLLASTVVAAAAVVSGASAASATARHIGIVVRYANGHVSAGCTTVGGNGLQVLERKHTVTMGTQQYSGFVLEIDGTGTSRPDNTHYWSYWHSSGRGGWTYASSGAGSYTPKAGTVEGWSYVNGQSTAPKPRSYSYAALCGHLDPTPAPKTTPSSAPASTPASSARPTQSAPPQTATPPAPTHVPVAIRTRSNADVAPPPPPRRHTSAPAHAPSATATHAREQSHPTRSATKAPTRHADPTTAAPSPVAKSTDSSSSAALPAIGALAVVAALGVTAWLVARRRAG